MNLDEITRSATARADLIRVRNALNPILWLCATGSPICFGAAYAFAADSVLRLALAGLGALPIIAALAAYFYFMLRDPDRLQSEEFVLRRLELKITERKGLPPPSIDVDMTDESSGPEPRSSEGT